MSETGNEVLLYHLAADDTCVLTTSCLLGISAYSAYAIAEEDIDLISMPGKVFLDSLNKSDEFRNFVFASFSGRLSAMMAKIEEVDFQSIGSRLANSLLKRPRKSCKVIVTREELAAEIGTAREVLVEKLPCGKKKDWLIEAGDIWF